MFEFVFPEKNGRRSDISQKSRLESLSKDVFDLRSLFTGAFIKKPHMKSEVKIWKNLDPIGSGKDK